MTSSASSQCILLASQSPRRAALLRQLGVQFDQHPADIDERQLSDESPEDYVARLAWEKAQAVASEHPEDRVVLAADTCVVLDGQVLGKPEDHFDALAMLARLSGREHLVLTAVCVRRGAQVEEALSDSRVTFLTLSRDQCEAYLKTDEPWDKAGAYGIQGLAGAFVASMTGSYSGIMGLPLAATWELLQRVRVATRLDLTSDG
ncbi:MAG: Maf family protein [Pseudomonadota bacterium]